MEPSTTYSNQTMVGNWWEDRHLPKIGEVGTTARVFGDLNTSVNDYTPTKLAAEHHMLSSPAPVKVIKPSMYSKEAIKERTETYGEPVSTCFTIGRATPPDQQLMKELHYKTTAAHFFKDLPEQARSQSPSTMTSERDLTHHRNSSLTKGMYTGRQTDEAVPTSGKGARGELTRNPKESGNVYGVSVFVDEYAQWQGKLNGMPLTQTVANMQTKYF